MYGFRLEMVPKKTIHWYWKRIQGIRDQLAGFGDGISPNKGFHWKEKGPASDPEIFWIKTENGIRYDQMFCETGETKFKMTSSSAASGFGSRHFDASSFWIHIPIRNTCYLICQNMLPGKKTRLSQKTQLFLAQHSPLHHSPNHHIPVARLLYIR